MSYDEAFIWCDGCGDPTEVHSRKGRPVVFIREELARKGWTRRLRDDTDWCKWCTEHFRPNAELEEYFS